MSLSFCQCSALVLWLITVETKDIIEWPDHDISTLKLLQIVNRHGDRTPQEDWVVPNDPFKNESYWPDGFGQLTLKGKYRMFKRGKFIRQAYNSYLGDKYSPREVYARSSIAARCIESASLLLSGAYPPNEAGQWNNGSDGELGKIWQPFPIYTLMPKENDTVLRETRPCRIVEKEHDKILSRPVIKKFLETNKKLYEKLSKICGSPINDIYSAAYLWDTLEKEVDKNYYWTKIWSEKEERDIIKKLSEAFEMKFRYRWDSPIIKRLRAGGLVKELNGNIQSVLNKENKIKLFVYSTHDTGLASLMHALNIWNDRSPTIGATLYLELHQKPNTIGDKINNFFVRAFFQNETEINSELPHLIAWKDCENKVDCPLGQYSNFSQKLIYEDFDKECNSIQNQRSNYTTIEFRADLSLHIGFKMKFRKRTSD